MNNYIVIYEIVPEETLVFMVPMAGLEHNIAKKIEAMHGKFAGVGPPELNPEMEQFVAEFSELFKDQLIYKSADKKGENLIVLGNSQIIFTGFLL